jgi:Type II secretion system (T2SS), protein M
MTTRDRIMLLAVAGVALLAGFWFMALGPKRSDSKALDAKLATAQQRLQTAQAAATQAEGAKSRYRSEYAAVARLGAAVPGDDNTATLLYQLQSAASGASVDLRTFALSGGATSSATSTPAASTSSSSASGSGSSSSGSSSSSSSSSSSGTTPAAATQAATATLPPGASVGTAGFPTMPFEFTFQGSFAEMQTLLRSIDGFVRVDGNRIDVRGRLLTVDGISLVPTTFPKVKAKIAATAFLLPADQSSTTAAQPSTGQSSTTTTPTSSATGVAAP